MVRGTEPIVAPKSTRARVNAQLGRNMIQFDRAVPVLQVSDVKRSVDFFIATLGFGAVFTFPKELPYAFAIVQRDSAEIMLQRSDKPVPLSAHSGWSVYVRVSGGQLLQLHEAAKQRTKIRRGPERMPYGDCEFEV